MERYKRHFGVVNKRLLEKLSVATVPADALETTRHLLKIVVKDATFAAHGLTKDALNHIKTHIIDIMPYLLLSAVTTNMVDEAAKEAKEKGESNHEQYEKDKGIQQKEPYVSLTSSSFASLKSLSRLKLIIN
eukprot:XP_024461431.1 uncharacterized protein LOC18101250 [Populus trichocarpa]